MTTLQEAARDALEALERIGKDFVCRSAHHAKKDQHSAFAECPVVVRHTDAIESLRTALAQQVTLVPQEWTNLLAYALQDDMHNRLTPRVVDIAYTAFTLAKRPNAEDGGASDWFNDTKPKVTELIAKLRKDLIEEFAAASAPVAQHGEQPVCHGCGIPAGDVHMSTCQSGKWPSRVSNGDTAAPAPQPSDLSHLATIAGLESSIGHLSALFNEQLLLLEEVEEKLGVDGMGNELNDGECVLIDRIREHLAAMAPPTRTAPQAQSPLASAVLALNTLWNKSSVKDSAIADQLAVCRVLAESEDDMELTDAQILALWEETYVQRGWTGIEFARAIERAHGIGVKQ